MSSLKINKLRCFRTLSVVRPITTSFSNSSAGCRAVMGANFPIGIRGFCGIPDRFEFIVLWVGEVALGKG